MINFLDNGTAADNDEGDSLSMFLIVLYCDDLCSFYRRSEKEFNNDNGSKCKKKVTMSQDSHFLA